VRPEHRALSLDQARYWRDAGLMTEAEYQTYVHAWQTSAPRFAIRACSCDECVARFPATEYRSLP
jgi:hypothetical protein